MIKAMNELREAEAPLKTELASLRAENESLKQVSFPSLYSPDVSVWITRVVWLLFIEVDLFFNRVPPRHQQLRPKLRRRRKQRNRNELKQRD